MCELAKKAVKPKRTGNAAVDLIDTSRFHQLVDGVNILFANKELAGDLTMHMRQFVREHNKNKSVGDGRWMGYDNRPTTDPSPPPPAPHHPPVAHHHQHHTRTPPVSFRPCCRWAEMTVFSRMEEQWVSVRLTKLLGWSIDTVAKVQGFDPMSLQHLWCYLHNTTFCCKVPQECCDHRVMEKVSDQRLGLAGNRHALLRAASGFVQEDGSLDWFLGPYQCTFDHPDGTLSLLVHRPTGHRADVDRGSGITDVYELYDGWSDRKAMLKKSKALKFVLADFFGPKRGPNSTQTWTGQCKELQEVAAIMQKEVLRAEKAGLSTTVSDDVAKKFKDVRDEKKKNATNAAREALSKRSEQFAKKRRISFKKPIAPMTPEQAELLPSTPVD